MKFLSEKDDVITAVLSKPAKAAEQLQNKDNAVRIGDAPNGAARTKVKIRKAGFSGASGASSSTTASGDIYRTETTAGTQVFHGKLERAELDDFLATNIPAAFKNAVIETTTETITILANKKGKCTVLRKKKSAQQRGEATAREARSEYAANALCATFGRSASTAPDMRNVQLLSAEMLAAGKTMHLSQPHDRQKNYLLKEGAPVEFLVRLGIMTPDGKIHAQKYSKFRQINRFLEYVDDILPELMEQPGQTENPRNATLPNMARAESQKTGTQPETDTTPEAPAPTTRALEIVDFGCGKSYLTFAVYYYLTVIKGMPTHITGIDLKKDVIQHCKQLASECGYKGMDFICGEVADFKGSEHPDLVITLHACDTATDYALSYAVKNDAKCILSVPCCQHELNSLLKKRVPDNAFSTMFKYGIIKERLSALATDVMRAELLENSGYSTQILEFIDMEDTPKNLLIRATKRAKHAKKSDLSALQSALGQTITLEKLLSQEE